MASTATSHLFSAATIQNKKEINRFIFSSSPTSASAAALWQPAAGFQLRLQASSSAFDHRFRCCSSSRDAPIVDVAVEGQPLSVPFHLAIPVHDIQAARDFYGGVLGLPEGRSAKTWVDFNFYGHQVVCHQVSHYSAENSANAVDGDPVPVPHFGLAMSVPSFLDLAERLKARGMPFIIKPHIRFSGQPGEQWTMFFKDKSGNSLEFKAMTNPSNLFAKYVVDE